MTNRPADTRPQIAAARALSPARATPEAGHAAARRRGAPGVPAGLARVERRRGRGPRVAPGAAADEAERIPMRLVGPVQALQLWRCSPGTRLRRGGPLPGSGCSVARRPYALPTWRVQALLRLGGNDFMRTANPTGLELGPAGRVLTSDAWCSRTTQDVLAMNATHCGDSSGPEDLERPAEHVLPHHTATSTCCSPRRRGAAQRGGAPRWRPTWPSSSGRRPELAAHPAGYGCAGRSARCSRRIGAASRRIRRIAPLGDGEPGIYYSPPVRPLPAAEDPSRGRAAGRSTRR